MSAFVPFHLYTSARVFVQHLRTKPGDVQVRASLRLLISALKAMKRKNPLAENFLMHVDFELMGTGAEDLRIYRDTEPGDTAMFNARKAQMTHQNQPKAYPPDHRDPCGPLIITKVGLSGLDQADNMTFGLPSRHRSPPSFGPRSPDRLYEQMDMTFDAGGGGQLSPPSGSGSRVNTVSPQSVSPQRQEQQFALEEYQARSRQKATASQNLVRNGSILTASTSGVGGNLSLWNDASMGSLPQSIAGVDFTNADLLNGISDAEWSHMVNTFGGSNVDQLV